MFAGSGQQHAGSGFAASAGGLLFVWAVIDCVNLSTCCCKPLTHLPMHGIQGVRGDKSLGDAALVTHDDYRESGLLEQSDRLGNTWQKMHILPAGHVSISRRLPVDYAVTI